MDKKTVGLFGALLVTAMYASALAMLFGAFLTETSAPAAAVETEARATRIITVAGTGTLETENSKWFVRGTGQPEVELGTIEFHRNYRTIIRTESSGFGEGSNEGFKEHYLNQRVTVIATVEVVVDDEKVFRAVRTARLTIFRHSDGLPDR